MPCWIAGLSCQRDGPASWCLPTKAEWTSAAGPQGSQFFNALAGNIEYLSSYVYRLVFNDDYWQAVSSEVKSDMSLTNAHRGFVPSVSLDRFQTFAGTRNHGDRYGLDQRQSGEDSSPAEPALDVLDGR